MPANIISRPIKILIAFAFCCSFMQLQFRATSQNPTQESLFVHTDRHLYIAGERVYFQLYLMPSEKYDQQSRIAYIALQGAGSELIENAILQLSNNVAYGSIYLPDTLSTGSYRLVFFTNRMRGYNENSHFSKPLFVVNRFDEQLEKLGLAEHSANDGIENAFQPGLEDNSESISLSTDKPTYNRREKVNLKLLFSDAADSLANVSVTVARDYSFLYHQNQDVGGHYTVHKRDDENAGPVNGFLPETRNIILGGQVSETDNLSGIAGARVLLSTPDSLLNLQYALSAEDGSFYFSVNDFYLKKPLYLTLDRNLTDRPASIRLFDKFDVPQYTDIIETRFRPGHTEHIRESQNVVRIEKVYNIDRNRIASHDLEHRGFRSLVYSEPEHKVYPAMFLALNDLPEISRELLPQLRMRRQANNYQTRMLDERTAYQFFNDAPAIFLDGIPVDDIGSITHLNSEKIERIEMQNRRWAYGSMRFDGILSIFSNNEAYRELELPESSQRIEEISYLEPSVFHTSDYENLPETAENLPDLRQLIYWKPGLQLEMGQELSLSFYTGDIKGIFIINVEGITSDGKRISAISQIHVNQILK